MFLAVRTEKFAKLFFIISCLGLVFYVLLAFYTFHSAYSNLSKLMKIQSKFIPKSMDRPKTFEHANNDILYILFWTAYNQTVDIEGQDLLEDNQCKYSNCYLTTNKNLLNNDFTQFDAIVYNMSSIHNWNRDIPKDRSIFQKYVFHSVEPANDHPVCFFFTDKYFNLTWTYKLDSDIVSSFFEVKDFQGNVVAPRNKAEWEVSVQNVSEKEISRLKRKKKAMVWVVDKCETSNGRLEYAKKLRSAFRTNLLDFDIFGCDMFDCTANECSELIENDYYFYFAAEESDSTDFVTAEVLKAYNNYAVPVVYGGANYKNFLPEGSYIDVKSMTIDAFVALVEYIIKNSSVYFNFHRWRNIYTIGHTRPFQGICELCEKLNERRRPRLKGDFRKWWFGKPLYERCFPGGADSYSEVFSYVNKSRHRL